jgi:hypothetical protein
MKGAIRVLVVGATAGLVAGDSSKQREQELLPEGAPLAAARKLAGLVGAEPTDDQASTIALAMHRGLGQGYGVAAAALTQRGAPPLAAGVAAGMAGFLVVDELANSLFFTPPPQAYPVESHLRGVVGHLTLGVVTGVLLALARRLRLL